jgi:PEP-CTERM motif
MVAAASAQAGASATGTYTDPRGFHITQATTSDYEPIVAAGETGFMLDTSGAVFSLNNVSVGLSRGQSVDLYYDYAITVRDDGLPASRDWGYCVPLGTGSNCGPAASGNEVAAVRLVAGFVDTRIPSPYLSVSGESVLVSTDSGSFADGVTQSGRLHVRVQASGDPFAPAFATASFSVYALVAVDANPVSPIPEPASLALVLAGLGAIGLRARARGLGR